MPTILIVDDSAAFRALLREVLTNQGHRVLETAHGAEALALTRTESPDLIITDLLMPTMDGFELLRQLRRDLVCRHLPVICYTGHYLEPEAQALVQACGVAFLCKPTSLDVLVGAMEAALAHTPPAPPLLPPDFDHAHRRLLTDTLARQVAQLQQEVAERQRAEAQLQVALHAKELLLKELHHRVKNNFQVLSSLLALYRSAQPDPQVQALFKDMQHRIRCLALVHDHLALSPERSRIDMAYYLRDLSMKVCRAYSPTTTPIPVTIRTEAVELSLEAAIPCGLIVYELLSNCLKHAFPPGHNGVIHLELYSGPAQQVTLRVRDTRVGWPADLDVDAPATLGWQLVRALTEQLEGTITLDHDGGTAVTLTFPNRAS